MQLRMAGATDIGKKRKTNQDSMFFDALQGIGIVADGIGGRKGGEIASAMAVDGLRQAYVSSDKIRHEEVATFLVSTIDQINREILIHGQMHADIEGLGTTLNCLVFVGDKLYLAHVGDSRTYLVKNGSLWQLTIDHNIDNFVERGWLPKSTLQSNPRGSALVRSLGLVPQVEVDIYEYNLRGDEVFVTCSDGLSGMVDDRRIAELVTKNLKNFDRLPAILVEEANRNGGRDNVTVVVSSVEGH